MSNVIEADLTWTGPQFETGIQVEIDAAGRIARVGRLGLQSTARLRGQALLPGMVNVHSHAFQRGLRGKGERFPAGAGSFWTWREAMYQLVTTLDEEGFYRISLQAFREMLASGITTVGEFHYFHHSAGKRDFAYDQVIRRAARDAGIRLVLLESYYRTGGVGLPLGTAQLRFETVSPAAFWEQVDRIQSTLDAARESLGVAPHSLRAATPEEIAVLHAEATRRGLVVHIHVEEQWKEIEDCVTGYGKPPMALLNDVLGTTRNVTAVHCTHTAPGDLAAFLEGGGTACLCPLTEGNLGDGIADLPGILAAGGRFCLGSDSNARISWPEEMRWLEYVQRLRSENRGVLRAPDGALASVLFRAATEAGAAALGVPAGAVVPGAWADFACLDLTAPSLAGWEVDTLMDAFVFGSDQSAIAESWVGGRRVYSGHQ